MADYLHIIKTKAYQNDSRLLKWIDALSNTGKTSSVFVLEDNNTSGRERKDKVDITKTSLFFRRFFKKGKGYLFKIPEFSTKSLKYIKQDQSKIIVFHDLQHYLTLLLLCLNKRNGKKIVWDLHELFHESLLKFSLTKGILEYILSRVDCIVYTNEFRRKDTLKKLDYTEKNYVILNNYTDKYYQEEGYKEIPDKLKSWLGNEQYIIWLGGGLNGRNFLSFLEAYSKMSDTFKLVMLGRPSTDAKQFIVDNGLGDRIYDTFVKPIEMLSYIDNATFSVVLYKHTSPNNYYCEPNRLYQLTSRGVPVIVGNNPQMKSLVQKYKAGIILKDDGTNAQELFQAMKRMEENANQFRKNLEEKQVAKELNWENQFSGILTVLNRL